MVDWFQIVFEPTTFSVTCAPCPTLPGDTLTIDALEAVTVNVNGKMVALPSASILVSRAVIDPTLATAFTVTFSITSVGEFTVIEFTLIRPVMSASMYAGEVELKFVFTPLMSMFSV